MPDITQHPSPNFNDRDPAVPLQFIVLHYTGMKSGAEALARLCDPASQVSAHYMIEEDGCIFKLLDEAKRAWHAGKSFWRGITDLNSASIGIELVNPGHEFGYRAFPAAQVTALKILLQDILKRHRLSPTLSLLAHSDIAPARKEDPGELFPWQELAKEGLGMWAAPQPNDYNSADDVELRVLLKAVGYDYSDLRATLIAFQRRYHPGNLTGNADPETVARLRAVVRFIK